MTDKWEYIKIQNFHSSSHVIKRLKGKPQKTHIRIYKNAYKSIEKRQNSVERRTRTYTQPLRCTPKTNTTLCQLYFTKDKKKAKWVVVSGWREGANSQEAVTMPDEIVKTDSS